MFSHPYLATRRSFSLLALLNFGTIPAFFSSTAVSAPPPVLAPLENRVSDLLHQPDASDAELWLLTYFPPGTTLAEAPHFFAAANEVFFDAEEQLLFFTYRSHEEGRWIAWVAFDPERGAVAHTAAARL